MTTCWLCQRIVSSRIDANTALPKWALNHMQHCSACRESYESTIALAQQLSATANAQRLSPSPFLHGKIMSAVRSSQNAESQPEPSRRLAWAMAVGMMLLLAAGIVWLRHPPLTDENASKSPATAPQLALNVNLPSVAQVDQWTKTLDAPLEQETKLVFRDATVAIDTLARGFLPEDILASSTETARP
jgi:hypothetical protein